MAGQKRRGRQITAEALEEKFSKAQDKLVTTKRPTMRLLRNFVICWKSGMLSGRMICITGWSTASGLMNR